MIDEEIRSYISNETLRQQNQLELIASENFASHEVLSTLGTPLNNKYAEGYPNRRYYGGCKYVDGVETIAIERAKKLFNVEWANVQPHSGAQANAAVYLAFCKPGDKLLGLDLMHGGHLTHGSKVNFSGKYFHAVYYGVDKNTERIDMDQVETIAKREKPRIISIGTSAYSRDFDYKAFRQIADKVGAFLWLDMAHIAGLIAVGLLNDPFEHCHIVSSTTHKTLRGPRGGILLIGKNSENTLGIKTIKTQKNKTWGSIFDSAVFPGTQGGPFMHVIAAKAVAFQEALQPNFKVYQQQVVKNAKAMADAFMNKGYHVISHGTDNHLILLDLRSKNITGKDAETALENAGITVNKNTIPFDTQSPFITSGIRIGAPALTTRGMKEQEFRHIVDLIDEVLTNINDVEIEKKVRDEVAFLCKKFPLPYHNWI